MNRKERWALQVLLRGRAWKRYAQARDVARAATNKNELRMARFFFASACAELFRYDIATAEAYCADAYDLARHTAERG